MSLVTNLFLSLHFCKITQVKYIYDMKRKNLPQKTVLWMKSIIIIISWFYGRHGIFVTYDTHKTLLNKHVQK